MTTFPTGAALTVTTGIVMCEVREVHKILAFLADRPVYTHEFGIFLEPAKNALLALHPDLPTSATEDNFRQVLAAAVERFGDMLDLPDALRGCIADDRSPAETLKALGVSPEQVIVVGIPPNDSLAIKED